MRTVICCCPFGFLSIGQDAAITMAAFPLPHQRWCLRSPLVMLTYVVWSSSDPSIGWNAVDSRVVSAVGVRVHVLLHAYDY